MGDLSSALCILRPVLMVAGKVFKSVRCNSIFGVCIPAKAGKSMFIDSISVSDNYLLLDLERNLELTMSSEDAQRLNALKGTASYQVHAYPIYKRYFDEIVKNYRRKSILVFSSDLRLMAYLNIKKTYTYIPSNSLADVMRSNLQEHDAKLFTDSRLELLLNAKKMISYNSFDDLQKAIQTKFKLQIKL
jgi:hypothetical protein